MLRIETDHIIFEERKVRSAALFGFFIKKDSNTPMILLASDGFKYLICPNDFGPIREECMHFLKKAWLMNLLSVKKYGTIASYKFIGGSVGPYWGTNNVFKYTEIPQTEKDKNNECS